VVSVSKYSLTSASVSIEIASKACTASSHTEKAMFVMNNSVYIVHTGIHGPRDLTSLEKRRLSCSSQRCLLQHNPSLHSADHQPSKGTCGRKRVSYLRVLALLYLHSQVCGHRQRTDEPTLLGSQYKSCRPHGSKASSLQANDDDELNYRIVEVNWTDRKEERC
jgi:hypothetical protein